MVVNLNAEAVYFFDKCRGEYQSTDQRQANALASIAASLIILTQHGEKNGDDIGRI